MSSVKNSRKRITDRRRSEGFISTPGPAAYYIRRDLCNTSISFTRASRSPCHHVSSPGPGSYNIFSEIGNGPKAVIARGRRNLESHFLAPGPTDYSPMFRGKSIGYSFTRNKKHKEANESTPGPGDYDIYVISNAPRATIGKAKRLLPEEGSDFKPIALKGKGKKTNFYSFDRPGKSNSTVSYLAGMKTEEGGKKDIRKKNSNLLMRKNTEKHSNLKENCKPPRSSSVKKNVKG